MSQPRSSTLTEIDPVTRDRVIASTNGKCWLCSLYGKHVTRVIAEPDLVLHHDLQRRSIIHIPDLNAFENLLYLCPNCHSGFDDRVPVWAFLPADLDDFISREERFQERRKAAASAGKLFPRALDQPDAISLLYTRYQILPGYLFTQIFTSTPVRHWLGSPLAVIIRSARIISGHGRLPVEEGGMPMDVALKFQRLLLLYGAPEPQILLQVDRSLELPVNINPYPLVGSTDKGLDELEYPVPNDPYPLEGPTDKEPDEPEYHVPELPREPPADNDSELSCIGGAFSSAIQYVNEHSDYYNLSPPAQAWLTAEVHQVVAKLQRELCSVHTYKDNPEQLPDYALDPEASLDIYSHIPYVLRPYRDQFESYLMQLMKRCGLTAKPVHYIKLILLRITFVPGAMSNETQTVGNRVFDPEVEKEFISGIHSIMFDKR